MIGVVYSLLENKLQRRDNKEEDGRELKKSIKYYEENPVSQGGAVFTEGGRYHIPLYTACCIFFEPNG